MPMRGAFVAVLVGLLSGCSALDEPQAGAAAPPASSASVSVQAAPTISPQGFGKGHPPTVEDFPSASAQFAFNGALSGTTSTGRPFSCGSGAGPDGITIFEYAVYLELGGAIRAFVVVIKPFTGAPATGQAGIDTVRADRVLTNEFVGSLQVAVSGGPSSYNGIVSGSLASHAQDGRAVDVSGKWLCSRGPLLGPG